MGFFDFLFKKKNKFDKLTRDEVVNSIIELERQEESLEHELDAKEKEIAMLKEKGRTEGNHQRKVLYAKKIQYLTQETNAIVQRIMYTMYNVSLLQKLKVAVDDKNFFLGSQNQSLTSLLADQRALAGFLNDALQTRVKAEDIFTSADETFNMIQSEYTPSEAIYGVSESEEEMLAIFEEGAQADAAASIGELDAPETTKTKSSN